MEYASAGSSNARQGLQASVLSTNIFFAIPQFTPTLLHMFLINPDTRKVILSTGQQGKSNTELEFHV